MTMRRSLHVRAVVNRGFTAIELLVYVALLVIISVFLIQSLLTLVFVYRRLQGERDVVANMRVAMETISREIQAARSIYTPATVFDANTHQLSLETPLNPLTNETHSFVDFYLDNERLYVKREGASAIPLTSESARVTQFNAARVLAGSRESVQVMLEVRSRAVGALETSSLVQASYSLRGNY